MKNWLFSDLETDWFRNLRKNACKTQEFGGSAKITNQKIEEKSYSAKNYLFQVYHKNTTKRREMCSKLNIKIPEQSQWRRSNLFIVHFGRISQIYLVLLFLDFGFWFYLMGISIHFTYWEIQNSKNLLIQVFFRSVFPSFMVNFNWLLIKSS